MPVAAQQALMLCFRICAQLHRVLQRTPLCIFANLTTLRLTCLTGVLLLHALQCNAPIVLLNTVRKPVTE